MSFSILVEAVLTSAIKSADVKHPRGTQLCVLVGDRTPVVAVLCYRLDRWTTTASGLAVKAAAQTLHDS